MYYLHSKTSSSMGGVTVNGKFRPGNTVRPMPTSVDWVLMMVENFGLAMRLMWIDRQLVGTVRGTMEDEAGPEKDRDSWNWDAESAWKRMYYVPQSIGYFASTRRDFEELRTFNRRQAAERHGREYMAACHRWGRISDWYEGKWVEAKNGEQRFVTKVNQDCTTFQDDGKISHQPPGMKCVLSDYEVMKGQGNPGEPAFLKFMEEQEKKFWYSEKKQHDTTPAQGEYQLTEQEFQDNWDKQSRPHQDSPRAAMADSGVSGSQRTGDRWGLDPVPAKGLGAGFRVMYRICLQWINRLLGIPPDKDKPAFDHDRIDQRIEELKEEDDFGFVAQTQQEAEAGRRRKSTQQHMDKEDDFGHAETVAANLKKHCEGNSIQINAHIQDLKREGKVRTEDISDGYHTFGELYDMRFALTVAVFQMTKRWWDEKPMPAIVGEKINPAWRSRKHSDDTMFDGMFIVGLSQFPGRMITFHYNDEHWDKFNFCETLEKAPKWDGHKDEDVIKRLLAL